MSKARSSHYEQTLPWDDQGSRLLTVANYEHCMQLLDGIRERMVRERARFIEDYEDNIDQARLDLGKLFRIEDYPSKEALQGRFGIRLPHHACAGRRPLHGEARLGRHRPGQARHRKPDRGTPARCRGRPLPAPRRGGSSGYPGRLQEEGEGKPLVFRDSMIENIRGLVDVVPRLNIFGDDTLARLCEQVKDKIAGVEPDSLRPSRAFDPAARARVKARRRRADGTVRGVFRACGRDCR